VAVMMFVAGGLLWGCGESSSDRGAWLSFSYEQPARMEIASRIRTLAVQPEKATDSDEHWSLLAADKMVDRLKDERARGRYAVVERAALQKMLEEQDLQIAFGDPDAVSRLSGKLTAIDAMIFIRVHLSKEQRRGTRISLVEGGPTNYTQHFVVVNMSVKMVDIATGSTLAALSKKYDFDSDREDKRGSLAKMVSASDAPASDAVTAELVERGVMDFLATISPHAVYVEEKLSAGKSPVLVQGNALAMSGDYDDALAQYQVALEQKPSDHGVLFNMGLVYEAKGDFASARKMYARAASMNEKDARYGKARARVSERR